MKNTILLSALVLLGGLGFTVAASAADVTCDDLVWSASVLADNPNIGAACLDVENKQGQEVAKFRARVVRQSVNSTIIQWQLPDGSWSPARNMGESINTSSSEYCPALSPDERYFFFTSDRSGNDEIYWVSAEIVESYRPE